MSTSERVKPSRQPASPTITTINSTPKVGDGLRIAIMAQENTPVRALAMEAKQKFVASPGTPLFPLSPERVNGARLPYGALPSSPSMPEFIKPSDFELNPTSPKKTVHSRNNSEALVQGMVARFDSLSLKDHQQMHRRDEVAIKRAEMAREMAEMELKKVREEREERENEAKRWREEYRKMKKESEEGRERERKMAKRLEAQADDVERTAKTHEHQRAVLDKDTRRLRKEAYKTESALVKLQEELKTTRNSLKVAQSAMESEKAKSFKREQEAFAAEYKLVGVQEELCKAQERLKVIEEERDALKRSLKEEEVARIAAEGRIALPESADGDDFGTPARSPRKKMLTADGEDKENMAPPRAAELRTLKEELTAQRRLRQRAEDQIEFMKMECQFRCCSCRMAEQRGGSYVHDNSFQLEMHTIRQSISRELSPPLTDEETEKKLDALLDQEVQDVDMKTMAVDMPKQFAAQEEQSRLQATRHAPRPTSSRSHSDRSELGQVSQRENSVLETSTSALFQPGDTQETPQRDQITSSMPALSMSPPVKKEVPEEEAAVPPETPWIPHTPRFREVRTVTTTTTIPLAFTPSSTPARVEEAAGPLTPATVGHLPSHKTASSEPHPFPASPGTALRPDGTLDREAALEQIRLRRGRARSMAMGLGTPKKQMVEGVARRDISAPAIKGR